MNINKIIVMGRITADPELKSSSSGVPVIRYTVAVNRPKVKDKEQVADFIECVAFRKTAEFIYNYFHKGSAIIVFGSLQTGTYEKDGQKRKTYTVITDEVQFGESKSLRAEGPENPTEPIDGLEDVTGDDLPF